VELKASHPAYLLYPMLESSMEVAARNIPVMTWTTFHLAMSTHNRINLM
jgi:hypothetical protein